MALARDLPGVKEDEYRGQAAACIRSTPFLLTGPDESALLRLPRATQQQLVARAPSVYCASEGRWGKLGWTRVRVPSVPRGELRTLVEEAHRLAAQRYAQRTLTDRRG